MKKFILSICLFAILTSLAYGVENVRAVSLELLSGTPSGSFYDLYVKDHNYYPLGPLDIANRFFAGYSAGEAYLQDSVCVEAGPAEMKIGYKKSVSTPGKLGVYGKYSYPPLKELDSLFLIKDFAYSDSLIDNKNTPETAGYIPFDAIYLNYDKNNITFRARTYSISEDSVINVADYKTLSFFKECTLELSVPWNNLRHGLYFIPGRMNDYYYKNVYGGASDFGNLAQYKDILVYGLSSGKFYFNLGVYDLKRVQYITVQNTLQHLSNQYIYYISSNLIDHSLGVFLSENYNHEFYFYYQFTDNKIPNYFISYANNVKQSDWYFHYMFTYKDTRHNQKHYAGLVYNLGINYPTPAGSYDLSLGTTCFDSVWNGWSVFPEKNATLQIRFKYQYDFIPGTIWFSKNN